MHIATDNNGDDAAIQSSGAEHGANRQQLSDGSSVSFTGGSPAGPNTRSVFDPGTRWENDTQSDVAALPVREGIEYHGDIALTSPRGRFESSNDDLYGNVGFHCANANLQLCENASNSVFHDPGDTPPNNAGNGSTGSGVSANTGNGVANFNASILLTEFDAWQMFIADLFAGGAEHTINNSGFTNENNKDGTARYTNVDMWDTNDDNIVLIDIDPRQGDTFSLNNTDWILDSDKNKLAIFRLVGDTILDMSNSSILAGMGYANAYAQGLMDGAAYYSSIVVSWENYGADVQVFNTDNTVLNGVAFWELSAFATDDYRENSNNRITLSNAQGCAQFIAPEVQFSNTRFNGCTTPVPVPAALPLILCGFGSLAALGIRRRLSA